MVSRLRTLGVSAAVALGVFVYLALPLLQEMFGPIVNIPVYAGIALLAGAVTWAVIGGLSDAAEGEPAGMQARRELENGTETDEKSGEDGTVPEPDVETEMEQLKEDL